MPNVSQIGFLKTLFSKLFKLPPSSLIIGGDFNIAFSEATDKLLISGKNLNPALQRLSKSFCQTIRKFSLFDLCIAHPTEREYSFFSAPHILHFQIDNFFGNVPALRWMITTEMGPISWLDHAPVSLTLDMGNVVTRICYLRLNKTLLKRPQHREELRQHIVYYFQANEG